MRTIVITGASDGIGAVAARELAGPDTHLILAGRSEAKLAKVVEATGGTPVVGDFARFDDVRRVAEEINAAVDHIDVLMNNAGGTFAPKNLTPDGLEPNAQINHLSPFLLTHLLKDRLDAAQGGALVLNTSSIANLAGRIRLDDLGHRTPSQVVAYGTSKLMNIVFSRGIQQRWSSGPSGAGIVSAAVHPGPVASSFGRDSFAVGLLYRTPLKRFGTITVDQGATPLVALAERGADPEINGVYFSRHTAHGWERGQASDQATIDGLWERSSEITGLA
jgi:NAD(P)-dependent dehydrogenase (short-subunit alcohol dehydrogenase family)